MTVTNNRNLTLPTSGGDSGVWGTLLNNGVMSYLDNILGATQAITINSADANLSVTQWNNAAFNLTGTLTGNRSLVLPLNANSMTVAVGGYFIVANNTTGAFAITVKTAASGSTGVTVAQGTASLLYSDATNVYNADSSKTQIIPFAGNPNGFVAGTAASLNNPPSVVWDYTNAALYFCTTTGNAAAAVWTLPVSPVLRGFDTAVNLSLSATHTGGNLLSVAVKTQGGTDPTVVNPVIVPFQTVSGSNTTGAVTSVSVTGALSMTTNATGASMGSSNNTPFRIWLALFNNSGTLVLAMRNCSTASGVQGTGEYGVASTVSISGSATSANLWYTPNGTTLSNCAFRIIGYIEYSSGLTTAGTYTADPNNTVIFGPGISLPGAVVNTTYAVISSGATTNVSGTSQVQTTTVGSITPTSTINLVLVDARGALDVVTNSTQSFAQISRGTSPTLIGARAVSAQNSNGNFDFIYPASLQALDKPASVIAVSYYVYVSSNQVGNTSNGWINSGTVTLQEIMG